MYNEDGEVQRISAIMTRRRKPSIFQTISAKETDEYVKSLENDWHDKTKPSACLIDKEKIRARTITETVTGRANNINANVDQ
jgi:hypothetical protein